MNKPIVSLWGFGPSYRRRVKLNILNAIDMGYDNMMDYVVLTDYPEDFTEFAKQTGKIKAIIDINKERKKYKWSEELEVIPGASLDAKAYGEEYQSNMSQNKMFSYSLHRFSFPTISKLGYNKIVFMDGDVKLRYDKIVNGEMTEEQFWNEFDTPANSMKGCVAETVYVDQETRTFVGSNAMGIGQSLLSLQLCSILLDKLNEKYKTATYPLVTRLPIAEGPFRYYHLESSEKVKELFDVWNECIRIVLSNIHYKNCQQCGGYMLCDYMPVATANLYCRVQVINFPNTVYNRQIHFEDRYFIPPGIPGLGGNFEVGDSVEDFLEKNKDIKKMMDEHKAWPHTEPY
jgi:hypothetical protein